MSRAPNVRDLLEGHITLELESIDRLYLNGYVPQLQHGAGLVGFLCQQRGQPIASPAFLGHITGKFVAQVKAFAKSKASHCFTLSVRNPKTGAPINCGESDQCAMRWSSLVYSLPPQSSSSSSSFSSSIFERC